MHKGISMNNISPMLTQKYLISNNNSTDNIGTNSYASTPTRPMSKDRFEKSNKTRKGLIIVSFIGAGLASFGGFVILGKKGKLGEGCKEFIDKIFKFNKSKIQNNIPDATKMTQDAQELAIKEASERFNAFISRNDLTLDEVKKFNRNNLNKTQIKQLDDLIAKLSEEQKVIPEITTDTAEEVTRAIASKVPSRLQKFSEDELMETLKKSGLKANMWHEYTFEIPQQQKANIVSRYKNTTDDTTGEILSGTLDEIIIKKIERPLSEEDIKIIQELANVCNGKYAQYFKENPIDLIALYQTLRGTHVNIAGMMLRTFSDSEWEVVLNTIKSKASGETLNALYRYKDQSGAVNKALSALKLDKNAEIPEETRKLIDNITSYINSQATSAPLKVKRYDTYSILDDVIVDNKKLYDLMQKAAKSGDQKEIEKCIHAIRMIGCSKTQERFLSTSLKEAPSTFSNRSSIIWELDIPVGTKGTYMETTNLSSSLIEEGQFEFLIQRNSQIEIKDANFIDGKWHLKGKVIQK